MSESFVDECVDGMLLGDAYVSKPGRFGFNHTIKQQEYFDYKIRLLAEQGLNLKTGKSNIPAHLIEPGRMVKSGVMLQAYSSITFHWKEKRNLWYPQGKKLVPANLKLTPTMLAYWYMDDGSANTRNRYVSHHNDVKYTYTGEPFIQQFRLYTDGFDKESQEFLQAQLKNLGVECWFRTRPNGLNRYIIISRLSSREKFKELVAPYVMDIPSMHYKINKPLQFSAGENKREDSTQVDDALFRTTENKNL